MKVGYKYTYNGKEHSARMLDKAPNVPVLTITMDLGEGYVSADITVAEAEQLANDLQELVQEIREHAAYLKSLEEAAQYD